MESGLRIGKTTCPGCGYVIEIGIFDNCRTVELTSQASVSEPYKEIEVYSVTCPDCALRFYAFCGYHHISRVFYEHFPSEEG